MRSVVPFCRDEVLRTGRPELHSLAGRGFGRRCSSDWKSLPHFPPLRSFEIAYLVGEPTNTDRASLHSAQNQVLFSVPALRIPPV